MKEQLHILHVISAPTGGGAEMLVRELGRLMNNTYLKTDIVYFNDKPQSYQGITYEKNEKVLNYGFKTPFSIFKLRSIFKSKLKKSSCLIIHVHLTRPLFFVVIASLGLNLKLVYTEHSTTK